MAMQLRILSLFSYTLYSICFVFALSCSALQDHHGATESGPPPPSPDMLEMGVHCHPSSLIRMGSDGTTRMMPVRDEPGTWVFFGETPRGSVKAIHQKGTATELPNENFDASLEIQPETHPVDIRPSSDSMDMKARYRFTMLSSGTPCRDSVRYSASRIGRERDPETGMSLAVSLRETTMGSGWIHIDAPGLWWITAERKTDDNSTEWASLSFRIPEKPGPDHYAAFLKDGAYLDCPDALAEAVSEAEVIFIGEKHDDPVAHMLEQEILAAVHRRKDKVALSMEMFERDVQSVLDGYLKGQYTERHFLDASRPWPRYAEDYRPMVEYAKEHGLPVIAANAPRRLVNLVSRKGPDALAEVPEAERRFLPPLPYHIPTEGRYVDKLSDVFKRIAKGEGESKLPGPRRKRDWLAKGKPHLDRFNELLSEGGGAKTPAGRMPPHGMMMAAKKKGNPSQSLWDAAMAYSISRHLEANPQVTVVQVNGAFHSDEHLGTVEQLLRYRPGTRITVISILPDESFPAFDRESFGGLGDVVIITDPSWQPDA